MRMHTSNLMLSDYSASIDPTKVVCVLFNNCCEEEKYEFDRLVPTDTLTLLESQLW